MKNINNRKIRQHHRLIAMMLEVAPNALPLSAVIARYENDPITKNLLDRPNAWAQYARNPCDDGINEAAIIINSVRGTKDQTYTLENAFAFTAEGRRFGNAEGTRLLSDEEILDMLSNGMPGETAIGSVAEVVNENPPEVVDVSTVAESILPSDVIDAMSLFADDEDVTVTDIVPDLSEPEVVLTSVEVVENAEVTDEAVTEGFPVTKTPAVEYVAPAKNARHIDPVTKKFCSRARAIELGLISEAA